MSQSLVRKVAGDRQGRRLLQRERTILEITELICSVMDDEGITRSTLAERLGTSKANVTQMLDGQRNLTVQTISDVLFCMDHALKASAATFLAAGRACSDDVVLSLHIADVQHPKAGVGWAAAHLDGEIHDYQQALAL